MNMDTPPEIILAELRERYPPLFSAPSAHLDLHPDVSQVVVAQVKSKFGELHFFYDGGDSYCMGAVALAEQMSLKTCERCSAPGKQISDRWVCTLCPMLDSSSHAGGKLVPTIISLSQARRRFRRLAALVVKGHSFIITRHGKPHLLMDAPEHWSTPKSGCLKEENICTPLQNELTRCATALSRDRGRRA